MLLEVELVRKRGNIIGTIPSIGVPLKKAREALQNGGSKPAADALIRTAIVAALNSDDLIERDRDAAVEEVKKRYEKALKATKIEYQPRRRRTRTTPRRSVNGGAGEPPMARLSQRELRSHLALK